MKRVILLTIGVLLIAGTCAWADQGAFIAKCGTCHKKGGTAPPVNPADKAAVVWKKYFMRGRHPVDLSDEIVPEELASIIEYLMNHAADSDQPEAALIPK